MGVYSAENIIDHAIDFAPVVIGGYIAYIVVKGLLDKEEEKKPKNTGKNLGEQIWWNFTHQGQW